MILVVTGVLYMVFMGYTNPIAVIVIAIRLEREGDEDDTFI